MRRYFIALTVFALVLTGCGSTPETAAEQKAAVEPPAPPSFAIDGFNAEQAAIMQEVLEGLGPNPLIKAASKGEFVAGRTEQPLHEGDLLVLLHADWTEDQEQCLRAAWQSKLVLAAFWLRLHERGDWVRAGHTLWNDNGTETEFHPGGSYECQAGYIFNADAPEYLFTGPSNDPSDLEVDREAFEAQIRERAADLGLTIDRLQIAGIVGTTVELVATAPDPAAIANDQRLQDLFDPEGDAELEGRFFVLRDPEGETALSTSWSIGLQGGSCGSSEKYVEYYDCGH